MSFLLAPTTAATFTYAAGTGFALNMLSSGNLSDSAGLVALQGVVFAASAAFAALAATYGTMTVVGVTAGVGFSVGVIAHFASNGGVKWNEAKLSLPEAGAVGALTAVVFAAVVVFSGRVFNNGLGAAGKFVATAAQPYVQPYVNRAWSHVQPLVDRAQPYVNQGIALARAKTGY